MRSFLIARFTPQTILMNRAFRQFAQVKTAIKQVAIESIKLVVLRRITACHSSHTTWTLSQKKRLAITLKHTLDMAVAGLRILIAIDKQSQSEAINRHRDMRPFLHFQFDTRGDMNHTRFRRHITTQFVRLASLKIDVRQYRCTRAFTQHRAWTVGLRRCPMRQINPKQNGALANGKDTARGTGDTILSSRVCLFAGKRH
mmetsp:Transcript_34570/g.56304  ORF Transcript_34570/g.56304 Transcript_34570/m.56304 type:complete len:200 (-) Transcript_34570:239-838(-)